MKAGNVELFHVVCDIPHAVTDMALIKTSTQKITNDRGFDRTIYIVDTGSPFRPLSCQGASSFPFHKPILAPVICHANLRCKMLLLC